MRKLTLLFASLLIVSCSADEAPADCNCDRITGPITAFNVVGVGYVGRYTTINDCTGIQKSWSYSGAIPKEGECRK